MAQKKGKLKETEKIRLFNKWDFTDLEVPLFMDTPFGRLSGKHRDHLIDTIPKMASQWILLATDTEFTAVEANVLRQTNTWGKIYELQKEEEGVTKIIERQVNEFTPKRKSIY